jgi:prepilin-type N-terminal cleavage/methylation domain-containing protein
VRGHRGFTLIEIMVALVISGLVASLAYATLQAGIDTSDRLTSRRATSDALASTHALVAAAVRHVVPGVAGGPVTFAVVRRTGATGHVLDSVTFLTRGIIEPYGTSSPWRSTLWISRDTLHFRAAPLTAGSPPVEARVPGIVALSVRALGRGAFADWQEEWSDTGATPVAVALTYTPRAGAGIAQVQRVGLERAP